MSMTEWAKREVEIASKRERGDKPESEWDYGCACYDSALKAFESLYYGEVIKKTPKGKVDVKYTLEIVNRFDTSGRDVNSPYCGNHYVEIENM